MLSPVTPDGRPSAVDGRTTRHAGDAVSQRIRKRIEEIFGWRDGWPLRPEVLSELGCYQV